MKHGQNLLQILQFDSQCLLDGLFYIRQSEVEPCRVQVLECIASFKDGNVGHIGSSDRPEGVQVVIDGENQQFCLPTDLQDRGNHVLIGQIRERYCRTRSIINLKIGPNPSELGCFSLFIVQPLIQELAGFFKSARSRLHHSENTDGLFKPFLQIFSVLVKALFFLFALLVLAFFSRAVKRQPGDPHGNPHLSPYDTTVVQPETPAAEVCTAPIHTNSFSSDAGSIHQIGETSQREPVL